MNQTIFHAINQFAGLNGLFDQIIIHLASNELFKAVPLVLLIWAFWFSHAPDQKTRRAKLFVTVLGSMAAVIVARAMALTMPYVTRPIHTEALEMRMPITLNPGTLQGWSSFPSDHGALLFALATGIFMVHRGWGTIALVHALIFGALTRVYLGLHWPADVFVGGLVGVCSALLLQAALVPRLLSRTALPLPDRHPQLFYALAFFVTYQLGTMFVATRWFAGAVATAVDI